MELTPAAKALNDAFQRDPAAMHALIFNRVPCTNKLAEEDPNVICEDSAVVPGGFTIGALGLINGVLNAYGLPRVGAKFELPTQPGEPLKLVGFASLPPLQNPVPVQKNDIPPDPPAAAG